MTISLYDQLVPTFTQMLNAFDKVLTKAEADAETRKIDPQVFLNARLAPDMLPFTRQLQICADHAKNGASRLAGLEPPKFPDEEKTFAELHTRLKNTIAHLAKFKPDQFDGAETRDIELKFPNATLKFKGKEYFVGFVVPNFYFHYTTAYDILRHNGVPIGKADFIGGR